MIFSKFERMVAGRYLRAKRKEGFISVITGFAFTGIALGVATLIIVMSVMNGFKSELLSRILGINGHIAFNEAAEDDDTITAQEFANLPTRVLPITRETRTINAYGYQRGDLRGMPEWCITIGMKQILASHKIYIALNRPWQHGIVKHVLFDKPQPQIPATLLQGHSSTTICAYKDVEIGLFE